MVQTKLSVIIPAFNEEAGICDTLVMLSNEKELEGVEIIVVDDGSTDRTSEIVSQFPGIHLIKRPYNQGYGSAIKIGIRASTRDYIIWFDADGQHRGEDLLNVANTLVGKRLDYCFGTRNGDSYEEPGRKVGKWILKGVVRLAAGRPVNDFNSGLRGFRKDVVNKYLHLLPSRFGASTVTTLLMLERNHLGEEVPILVKKRIGKSSVKQFRDGIKTLLLILHIFILFKPMLFFGVTGAIFIVSGGIYGIIKSLSVGLGFPVLASLLVIFGFQSFFFGLLCDQISGMRRDKLE